MIYAPTGCHPYHIEDQFAYFTGDEPPLKVLSGYHFTGLTGQPSSQGPLRVGEDPGNEVVLFVFKCKHILRLVSNS